MAQFQRSIDGQLYGINMFEGEISSQLTYENVKITLTEGDGRYVYAPGLTVVFIVEGSRYTFPLHCPDFEEGLLGTLVITPQSVLSVGVHAFPFKMAETNPPGYGSRGMGVAGYGTLVYLEQELALPSMRYYITGWAEYSQDFVEKHYIRGIIT